jgi:carbamoyltransferase
LFVGVTANIRLNQRIFEIEGTDHILFYPNMDDGGCGKGAAFYHSQTGDCRPAITDAFIGPNFSEFEIVKELKSAGLEMEKPINLAELVAQYIHNGKVVASFYGLMEYGPRALGNRSIIYTRESSKLTSD